MKKVDSLNQIFQIEWLGFGALIGLLWLDEWLDLPHILFQSPPTPVNWSEGIIETLLVGLMAIFESRMFFFYRKRIKNLEGIFPICGFCQRIQNGPDWISLDNFLKQNSDIRYDNKLMVCQACLEKMKETTPDITKLPKLKRTDLVLRKSKIRKIFQAEIIGYTLILALLWLDELVDLPHLLLGAKPTPVNWAESFLESFFVLLIALSTAHISKTLLGRVTHLQGVLGRCSFCNNLFDGEDWVPLKDWIKTHSHTEFASAICFDCLKKAFYLSSSQSDDENEVDKPG